MTLREFYKDKKVFLTGHTGFKGSWMCEILKSMGAEVTGYSLEPPTIPSVFEILHVSEGMNSYIGDIRDYGSLKKIFDETRPEIVIHMAAQPIVRESYRNPVGTYETNVMGTVNILECCRLMDCVRSVVNVTTDKVYRNLEQNKGYVESDFLDGYDPYSNSKSCSELVTHSYVQSFLNDKGIAVSTCRAGNVIGGGDFAADRIIPDCVRAMQNKADIIVRNPHSIRPYQHVLEPLFTYLMIAKAQYEDGTLAGAYNVGPDDNNCVTTGTLATMFCTKWQDGAKWIDKYDGGPHEATFLKLDCAKLKATFGWNPVWDMDSTMDKLVEWYKIYIKNGDIRECTINQIEEFEKCLNR